MTKFRIAVPTDMSEAGNTAFETAEKFRKLFDGTITPIHIFKQVVWPDGISVPHLDEILSEKDKGNIKKRLRRFAESFTEEGFIEDPILDYGEPITKIIEKTSGFDLVVLSTHGRKGFSRAVMGSVADKLIRNTRVPVVVSKWGNQGKSNIKKILVTTDFSKESYVAFDVVKKLLGLTKAEVSLVHIISLEHLGDINLGQKLAADREEELHILKAKKFKEFEDRVEPEVHISSNSPHEALTRMIESRDYDLLVISTIGQTGFKYMLLGSNTASLVQTSKCPVYVVKPNYSE